MNSPEFTRKLRTRWCVWVLRCTLTTGSVFAQLSVFDSSFDVGQGADAPVNTLLVLPDGRILVGGDFAYLGGQPVQYLTRLDSNGALDPAFNPAGSTDGSIWRLLAQPDGKVLVGGQFSTLLGVQRAGLARLLPEGSVDPTFDAGLALGPEPKVFALALQDNGRIVVGYTVPNPTEVLAHIARLETNGLADLTFNCATEFKGFPLALLPLPDGSLLLGGTIYGVGSVSRQSLFHILPDGSLDAGFAPGFETCSIFSLVPKPGGEILVGGLLKRSRDAQPLGLLQLTPDLHWDDSFKPDPLWTEAGPGKAFASALLLQSDGKLLVGGYFTEVAGYCRREMARLDAAGSIDGCFDPGLGLGGNELSGPVRALAAQSDGKVLVGGAFYTTDGMARNHLARVLPQSLCDLIRVHLIPDVCVAATFPARGTNILEWSADLASWQPLQSTTNAYIFQPGVKMGTPQAFFRARQER